MWQDWLDSELTITLVMICGMARALHRRRRKIPDEPSSLRGPTIEVLTQLRPMLERWVVLRPAIPAKDGPFKRLPRSAPRKLLAPRNK